MTVTVGVVLKVPEPHATELQRARAGYGDDGQAEGTPTHITVLAPVEMPEASLPSIVEHLSAIAQESEPFEVSLRGSETFRPVTPVVYLALAQGAPECAQLARRVRSGPLMCTTEYPYHPHVTLAHKVDEQQLDRAAAEFDRYRLDFAADAYHLYTWQNEAQWCPHSSFRLGHGLVHGVSTHDVAAG